MSATDQFPPRHLLPDDLETDKAKTSQGEGADTEQKEKTGSTASSQSQTLALPAPTGGTSTSRGTARDLDVSKEGGARIALDELGPMVVNKDGTLSRIHNWANMTDLERERTLRVLGKRNQLRIRDIKAGEQTEDIIEQ